MRLHSYSVNWEDLLHHLTREIPDCAQALLKDIVWRPSTKQRLFEISCFKFYPSWRGLAQFSNTGEHYFEVVQRCQRVLTVPHAGAVVSVNQVAGTNRWVSPIMSFTSSLPPTMGEERVDWSFKLERINLKASRMRSIFFGNNTK